MANTFTNLDVPAGEGAGKPFDTAFAGAPKSFAFSGATRGRYLVEGSHDGTAWATLFGRDRARALFFGKRAVFKTVEGVVKLVRVRGVGTRNVTTPPSMGLAAAATRA